MENTKNEFMSEIEAKMAIVDIGKRMYDKSFVAANDGNISIKVSPVALWVTPTGVSKGFMTPDMLVKIDLDGKVLEGSSQASSEIKMHLRVYKENPKIKAVTHAHPPVATSFAIAGIALDRPLLPEAIVNLGIVPIAKYATPGSQAVPDSIGGFCKGYNGVLLANHGALTWGKDILQAYFRLESLEHYATVTLNTKYIIKAAMELSDSKVSELIELRTKMGIEAGGTPTAGK